MKRKRKNVQSLDPDHDLSLVLSQDLDLANVQHQEVDLDLRVLSKTVKSFYSMCTLGIFYCNDQNTITQCKIYKGLLLFNEEHLMHFSVNVNAHTF